MYRLFIHFFSFNCIISLLMFLFVIFLIILNKRIRKTKKNRIIWKRLCFLPLITTVIHMLIFNFHNSFSDGLYYFGIMYIYSILICLWQLVINKKILYKIFTIILIIIGLIQLFIINYNTITIENIHNLSYQSYTKSFKNTLKILKKEYVLNEHKQIDYNYLENKYYPIIEKSEQDNDSSLYYKTMFEFTKEFKDGHFYTFCKTEECSKQLYENFENRYYGFATIKLSDGKVIAIYVCESSDAYKKGLRDGMIITKKDNVNIEEAIDKAIIPETYNYPVKEDESFIKTIDLFSNGDKTTSITFINEMNEEITASIKEMPESSRKKEYAIGKAYDKFFYNNEDMNNLDTKMLNNNIGYLKIDSEAYKPILGALTYVNDDSSFVSDYIIEQLDQLKEKGMEKLIIDLRYNSGGFVSESAAIASIFTNKSYTYAKSSKKGSKVFDEFKINAKGNYSNIPIIVIVNSATISAGDALVNLLSNSLNIKTMGFTNSNNSCQSVGGKIYLTDGDLTIDYPVYHMFTTDNKVFIDTKKDGIATMKLDIKIPITIDNYKDIIYSDNDYELNYAMDYLNNKN